MNIKKNISNNLKYKIIVSFLAILLWFFVKTEDNYKYSFNVPLQITNIGEDRTIMNELPKQVEATFWGKGRSLLSLKLRRDISYNLDVAKIKENTEIVLDKKNIRMLRKNHVEVLNIIQPKTVEVIMNKLVQKKVPVTAECIIGTIPGYTTVGEIKLIPDSVIIKGPQSEIELVSSVFTEKKIYKKIKRDLEKKIELVKPAQKNISLNISYVHLFADIQKLMEKPLIEIPVKVINKQRNTEVTVIPSTLSLVLEGGTDLLLNITQADVKAYIDYKKVKASREKDHPAYIVPPDGVRYRDVKPKRFKIVVERKK